MSRTVPAADFGDRAEMAMLVLEGNFIPDPIPGFPPHPLHAACLDAMANAMKEVRTLAVERIDQLVSAKPSFVNHLVLWALGFKSEEELSSMTTRWETCTCFTREDQRLRQFHTYPDSRSLSEEKAEAQLRAFTDTVFHTLITLVIGLDSPVRALKIVKNGPSYSVNQSGELEWRRKDAAYWALAHSIMADPQTFVRSCIAWFYLQPIPPVISFLAASSEYVYKTDDYNKTLLEFPDFSARLVEAVKSMWTTIVYATVFHMKGFHIYLHETQIAARFLSNLHPDDPDSTLYGYLTPHANLIFTTIDEIILSMGPKPSKALQEAAKGMVPDLVLLAKDLYPSVEGIAGAPQIYARLLQQPSELMGPDNQTAVLLFLQNISRTQHAKRCCNPTCFGTSKNGTARHRCASCLAYTYCSKECQRAGWKHPLYPHKSTCKKLTALKAVWRWDVHDNVAKHMLETYPEAKASAIAKRLARLAEGVGLKEETFRELIKEVVPIYWDLERVRSLQEELSEEQSADV